MNINFKTTQHRETSTALYNNSTDLYTLRSLKRNRFENKYI